MRSTRDTGLMNSLVFKIATITCLCLVMLCGQIQMAKASTDPIRIVVLPFYNEQGNDTNQGGDSTIHYRRMMRFINNQLVRHNFEVINPFAHDSAEREYNRIMERSLDDSSLSCMEMNKKYGTDAAYIVWLDVTVETTSDGYCKASARLEGEGYDSGGRDLGVGVSKTFKITKRSCDDSIVEVEKEVGDLVGRKLTAWSGRSSRASAPVHSSQNIVESAPVYGGSSMSAPEHRDGGVLIKNIEKTENLINIRLEGATEYEVTEVFGKVVNTVTGVVHAKRYSSRLIPDNPAASYQIWRVTIQNSDPFRLQANIVKMLNDISDNGGSIVLKGVPYRYTAAEVDLLKGVRPGDATTRELQFVLDRELVRDREFSGRHDAYKAGGNPGGFE